MNRVKSLLPALISNTQSAFLKGRNIHDNVLLMKEVLHSFQSTKYMESAFALKADLFKAFDTIGWVYLRMTLQKLGFPKKLTNLIMSCVSGSKFIIKLNGADGNEFITPT
jgi:Reverse transcriptase (RNA-dependent DNA polymerase)